ncbi:MAG TPA: hypothetical protein VMF60_08065, partial [Acidimicrobiales bacterium]|nr:hypothetical protein [Acidimicrobiales bacterium]
MRRNVIWTSGDPDLDAEEFRPRRFAHGPVVIGNHPDLVEAMQELSPEVVSVLFRPDAFVRAKYAHRALVAA